MSDDSRQQRAPAVPGAIWRILAKDGSREVTLENQGVFDELVIDDWLHLEQMDERSWWMRVGDASIHVVINKDGSVEVSVERDVYDVA
ncbi:MAG TPA: hypothetical protein VM820_12930 [Vicinamibacterales bacterium]|nr:hypothetical protein [Vicinamibacterales bacterium]